MAKKGLEKLIQVKDGSIILEGVLAIPKKAKGVVLFAHGSGSGRFSPRNNFVAGVLQKNGMGTFLIDLLTEEEDEVYESRFNINLLTQRLLVAIKWLEKAKETKNLTIGLFGASTGAAAALKVASFLGSKIGAVVSRGGRPDLASEVLNQVKSPMLFIVGGNDFGVIELNKDAYNKLKCVKKLEIIKGATHLFEEPGALEKVAQLSASWFKRYL